MAKKQTNEVNKTITLSKDECVNIFQEEAKKVAQMVCGRGECLCGHYNCGHSNTQNIMPMIGTNTTCPLARYNATPDSRPWYECLGEEQVTLDGLFAICACCEGATVTQDANEMVIHHNDLEHTCLDCPVHMARESIYENMAEAYCS